MSLNMSPRSDSSDDGLSVNDILSSTKDRIQTPPLFFNQLNETSERFETLPNRSMHEKFLRDSVEEILSTAIFRDLRRENKVCNWTQPSDLAKLFDMSVKAEGDNDDTLLDLLRKTIHYSVKTGHPYFVNQLYSCVDAYGLVGQWLTDALNPSVYTYEVSPVFILMEETVLRQMRSIVGWENGKGDGLFSPGGSISNGYGISCARFKYTPDVKVMNTKPIFVEFYQIFSMPTFNLLNRLKDYRLYPDWLCSPLKMHIIHPRNWPRSWVLVQIMCTK